MAQDVSSVLIIGATGQIGREVVAVAQAEGLEPIAASRNPDRAAADLGVRTVAFDITNPEGIRDAVAAADAVVLTHGGDSQPEGFFDTTNAVVTAAEEFNKPVALMTSMGVSQPPEGWARDIILAKQRAEARLRDTDLHYIIVRPGWFGYQSPNDVRLDIRQGDLVTGQVGVDPRHIAQVLLYGLIDADKNYTVELFSQPGEPVTGKEWDELFSALTPD